MHRVNDFEKYCITTHLIDVIEQIALNYHFDCYTRHVYSFCLNKHFRTDYCFTVIFHTISFALTMSAFPTFLKSFGDSYLGTVYPSFANAQSIGYTLLG